ncbi:MAG: ribonuclease [Lachnospiraceae bacterium]|nr:ribonuclease [Lachnospiraceae bacterium]
MKKRSFFCLFLCLIVIFSLAGCGVEYSYDVGTASGSLEATEDNPESGEADDNADIFREDDAIDEDGIYDSRDEVAMYIYLYGTLPQNYITKKEAKDLGWNGGSLSDPAPGKCIGGDYFGNYEGILPEEDEYTECDIDTLESGRRGPKRIVFSDDGDIYYTDDHYDTFSKAEFDESDSGLEVEFWDYF